MGDYPWRGTEERQKELREALNEIVTWACEELPDGWVITLSMMGGETRDGEPYGDGEACLRLQDPDGNEVSSHWDTERTNVWDMVDHARNPDA